MQYEESLSYTNEFFELMHWFAPGTDPVTCQRLSTWLKVLWLEAKTHDNVSISIVNMH